MPQIFNEPLELDPRPPDRSLSRDSNRRSPTGPVYTLDFDLEQMSRPLHHLERFTYLSRAVSTSFYNAGELESRWMTYTLRSLPVFAGRDLHPELVLNRCGQGWVPEQEPDYSWVPEKWPSYSSSEVYIDVIDIVRIIGSRQSRPRSTLRDMPLRPELWKLRSPKAYLYASTSKSLLSTRRYRSPPSEVAIKNSKSSGRTGTDNTQIGHLVDQLFTLWPKSVAYYYALGAGSDSGKNVAASAGSVDGAKQAVAPVTNADKKHDPTKVSLPGNNLKAKGKLQQRVRNETVTCWRCIHEACLASDDESCDGHTSFTAMLTHTEKSKRHQSNVYNGKSFKFYYDKYGRHHRVANDESRELLSAVLFRSMQPTEPIPYLRFNRCPNGTREPLPLFESTVDYASIWTGNTPIQQTVAVAFQPSLSQLHEIGELMTTPSVGPPQGQYAAGARTPLPDLPSISVSRENDVGAVPFDVNHEAQGYYGTFSPHLHGHSSNSPTESWGQVNAPHIPSESTQALSPSPVQGVTLKVQYARARTHALRHLQQDPSYRVLVENSLAMTTSAQEDENHEAKRVKDNYDDSIAELNLATAEQNLDPSSRKRKREEIENQRREDLEAIRMNSRRIRDDATRSIEQHLAPYISAQLESSGYGTPTSGISVPNPFSTQFPDLFPPPQHPDSISRDISREGS